MKKEQPNKKVEDLKESELNALFELYKYNQYPEKEYEPYHSLETFKKGIKDESLMLLHTDTNELAAFASYTQKRGFIHLLCVAKKHRNKGLGTALINQIDTVCTNNGYNKELRLIADDKNQSGKAFYEAHGFIPSPVKKGTDFEKVVEYKRPLNIDPLKPLNITLMSADINVRNEGLKQVLDRNIKVNKEPFRIVQEHENGCVIVDHKEKDDGNFEIKTTFDDSVYIVDTNKPSEQLDPNQLIAYIESTLSNPDPNTKKLKKDGFYVHMIARCLNHMYFDITIDVKNGEKEITVEKKENLILLPESYTLLDWVL